ncbi:DNA replication/repair protein RecF [Psychrobacter ciconiae]|uniref:DNA replication/repair protein RecF n=1 Tax=Psychrobacter ciconiae TaxID=1553449 RepID=UPI00191AE013|nr:DNA replication and repair protein RecF [Psychrobacter ciconiae]
MIERLQISHLRNLTQVQLALKSCNVIIGANGSGKTSLLEAIFLLSRGKSFRHHQPKRYIEHHQSSVTVFSSLVDGSSLAIQKQLDATTSLRINYSNVYNQSALTAKLPTLLIDPSSMEMLEQGSTNRRQLLDWLVFHMKPGFHPQWLAYQRLLKQRNQLLKQPKPLSKAQLSELRAWDQGLSNHAALIDHYRQQVFEAWQPYFQDIIAKLLPKYAAQLSLSYTAGFDSQLPLDEQLAKRLDQDLKLGYSRIGSHRADVHVHWHSKSIEKSEDNEAPTVTTETKIIKEQAANVLSRGEKKLLITALKLSQLPLLTQNPVKATEPSAVPMVLIDDITAELDDRAIHILLDTLSKLPCQLFITSLSDEILPLIKKYCSEPKLFHVKHGQVSDFSLDS